MILAICLMILILIGQLNLLCQLQYFFTFIIKSFFFCHLALFWQFLDHGALSPGVILLFILSQSSSAAMTSCKLTVYLPGSLASLTLQTQLPASVVGITRLVSGLASVLFDFKVCNIFSLYLQHVVFLILSGLIYPASPR